MKNRPQMLRRSIASNANYWANEWKTILQKAWDAGIPHVIFTGGEPTLRPDLPDLITLTENIGMVCGLLTDGLRLSDPKGRHELLQCGLDHLMIVLETDEDQAWEALRDVLAADIFTTVHLTITQKNAAQVPELLDRLAGMGVNSLSLSTDDTALKRDLKASHAPGSRSRLDPGLGFAGTLWKHAPGGLRAEKPRRAPQGCRQGLAVCRTGW